MATLATSPGVPPSMAAPVVPDHILKRVAWRRLPYVFLLYIIAFIDRVNVSYAALGLTKESGYNGDVLGFGAGSFFIGYVVR